ncbi:MAG: hypothetical protein CO186_12845 [Zetaproteobacteria bacterium CG_4_9_14_3_um_filter_49_83]|nr:MAG: hypothetical protein AUJ56_07810 [Zetaproteobacteria bacterium CG1_02_49_23]PIQ32802.1 MAG: hypothetical protein COW62_06785 [Zetaproteobacteria bacterium CG17_big_fil_post_rev_8_21_14_2_50_50_13]PIV29870.1 MAG: hypothetical protein COS35_09775 [Zetaproteobacteria bacterium CG02_land_8_20_14_3_00_50_9]PIY56679.1 MAG: hypothetical protein COZ00_03015 [Zetaproteobacteria bacterium CG_4_10_14_0_8_um_filter_49_80]PJA33767.1 MAG: hypothetical protein CO186_12845 [Zetaproteobacteria bacterium
MHYSEKGMIHLVDGNLYALKFISDLLIGQGYNTLTFSDSLSYSDFAHSREFKLPRGTFVDVDTPALRGYRLICDVQAIHPDLRFVVMSNEQSVCNSLKDLGCMYLKKPLNPSSVEVAVKKLTACHCNGASEQIGCGVTEVGFHKAVDWACPKSLSESCS